MSKIRTAEQAAELVRDGAVVAVNSSSGLLCPDHMLRALGERFAAEGAPRGLTTIHPIAAGDMFGTPGVDHIAHPGMISRIIGELYPSGPSNAEPPKSGSASWPRRSRPITCPRASSSTCCARAARSAPAC